MTTLNTVVAGSLASIANINAEVLRLNEEAKTARQNALEPFLTALAESGEVSIIVVRGYTPGFNDGEPCEHSAEFWVNLKELNEESVLHEVSDQFDLELPEIEPDQKWSMSESRRIDIEGATDRNVKAAGGAGHIYAPPSSEVRSAIKTLIFDTAEEENGTNYIIAYVLKDGKFDVHKGEYDCGY